MLKALQHTQVRSLKPNVLFPYHFSYMHISANKLKILIPNSVICNAILEPEEMTPNPLKWGLI